MSAFASERVRFWVITAAAVLGVVVTASLGRWQLARAATKEAVQASMEERGRQPALAGASLAADGVPADSLLHRQVVARGTWVAERTVYLDNRPMGGRTGLYVVTPLRLLESKAVVLVQRGWVPRNFEDRTRLPAIDTPPGPVEVRGRIVPPPAKLYEIGEAESGPIRQNLDLARFRSETGLALAAVSIQQLEGAEDGLKRDWPQPLVGVAKNYGYAFQWFGLSALITALYVWFQIVRRFKRRAD